MPSGPGVSPGPPCSPKILTLRKQDLTSLRLRGSHCTWNNLASNCEPIIKNLQKYSIDKSCPGRKLFFLIDATVAAGSPQHQSLMHLESGGGHTCLFSLMWAGAWKENTFSSKEFYSNGNEELDFFSDYRGKQPENCAALLKVFAGRGGGREEGGCSWS